MDTGTNIIGLLFLLFCLIIFVIISRNNRNKEKQLLLLLEGMAAQNNCKIIQHDTWYNAAIGIDFHADRLFAVSMTNHRPEYTTVDLSGVQKCSIIKTVSMGNDRQDNFKAVERLELAFTFSDKDQPGINVDFFNTGEGSRALNGELQLVEKWHNLVSNRSAFSKVTP